MLEADIRSIIPDLITGLLLLVVIILIVLVTCTFIVILATQVNIYMGILGLLILGVVLTGGLLRKVTWTDISHQSRNNSGRRHEDRIELGLLAQECHSYPKLEYRTSIV